jgi:hypothetical protein
MYMNRTPLVKELLRRYIVDIIIVQNIEVAIKAIYLDNKKISDRKLFTKRITNEIKIMLHLQHPNIIHPL